MHQEIKWTAQELHWRARRASARYISIAEERLAGTELKDLPPADRRKAWEGIQKEFAKHIKRLGSRVRGLPMFSVLSYFR
jgi:hypothetical protein